METRTYVLFDFDGVIADSLAVGHDIARSVHGEKEMTLDDYRKLFEGNVYDSLEKAGHRRKDTEFFNAYSKRMGEVTLMPDVSDAVKRLASQHTLCIISSTTSDLIRRFLIKHSLEKYFADVLGADVHASKVEKMRMIFERYDTDADRCVMITDTLGDMREAKQHEMGTIAVSWGWHDRATLEKGVPFRIVETPDQLVDAVADYFSRETR